MKSPTRLAAIVLVCLAGCDKSAKSSAPVDAGPPAAPLTVHETVDDRLQATGSVAAKGGEELEYKQAFDAANILDLALCGTHVYGLARGGRIVEWNPETLAPQQVLGDFGAATSIDANDRVLLVGTADGRLLNSDCDGRQPMTSPDPSWPVRFVHLDARSHTRAFVVYEEAPDKVNKLDSPHATVALVDLETGAGVHEPFRTPWSPGAVASGFVDYKGELWFDLTAPRHRSHVWYMERFDAHQPPLADLGANDVVHGFVQVSREVWAYGGLVDGSRGFIYRVDSNRAKPKWDGEKAWFGEQPGGDLPDGPITAIESRGKDLIVSTMGNVYRVDPELRRWSKLYANDPVPDVLASATAPITAAKRILIGTSHGLVAVVDQQWSRGTIPPFAPMAAGAEPTAEVTWNDQIWTATDRGLTSRPVDSERSSKFRRGPSRKVYGLFVDGAQRLWAFAHDGIWLIRGTDRGQQTRWDTVAIGLAPVLIATVAQGGTDDAIALTTTYGGEFRLRFATAPPAAPE